MQHAEPFVRVVDLRIKPKSADSAATPTLGAAATSDKDASVPLTQSLAGTRDLSAEAPQKAVPSVAPPAQTALERLQDMAGSELLRATNLVLKDGGGEIRLVLKPESLGSVRIRMNIVDNAIEGRIIVDSSSVKQVMEASIDALRRALTAEGFQTGSLQVSVGGQNAETGGRQEQDRQPQPVRRIAAQGFGSNVPGVENVSLGDLLVNVFV
jgi:flagellar hook-length control protein FliK